MGEEPEVRSAAGRRFFSGLILLFALPLITASAAAEDGSAPVIREEQHVHIDGVDETWQLEWTHKPHPKCTPSSDEGWASCPCNPFAFGEAGLLSLVRLRNGSEYERLPLTGYFTEESYGLETEATLQSREMRTDDISRNDKITDEEIARRPLVRLMRFVDYDHDGRATEFMLPVFNLVCGHQMAIVVGVSTMNPHLHVFGSVEAPKKALKLEPRVWKALAQGKTRVVEFRCFDHGMEAELDLDLRTAKAGISVKQLHYSCQSNGNRGRKLSDAELSKLQQPPE